MTGHPDPSRRTVLALGSGLAVAGLLPAAQAQASLGPAEAASPTATASIVGLQARMAAGHLTSRQLTACYLERIARLNPLLHAILETDPDALRTAARLDAERRAGKVRGPLHGIPVTVKDNLATRDRMQTTAGSRALLGSKVPDDADVISSLRRAGAVIIGKNNLSEWANYRGAGGYNGWSGRGGFTRNPYRVDLDPSGSSSGSAAAVAASLCAVSLGTETNGSIVGPCAAQSVVGLKPTVGLLSQRGIIPISWSQDSAGPIGRSVADVAAVLTALRPSGGRAGGTVLPADYRTFLRGRSALKRVRIVLDTTYEATPEVGDPVDELFRAVMAQVAAAGATVIRRGSPEPFASVDGVDLIDAESSVLAHEFKIGINRYLAGLTGTRMRTLADLIAFNTKDCSAELRYFGQESFLEAEATSGDARDPRYLKMVRITRSWGRRSIDQALGDDGQVVAYSGDGLGRIPSALAGQPIISVPIGYTGDGQPVGLLLAARRYQEPALIAVASAIEDLVRVWRPPTLAGTVPEEPEVIPCPT